MHLAFQFGESHEPCAVVNRQFRMSRNGRHLGHVGGAEVPSRKPVRTAVYGELLTLLSIFCQRRFECAKATDLLLFGTTKRIPFKQLLFPVSTDALW